MTLAQVGGEDLTRAFISMVERGKSSISLESLQLVAERLGYPISHFLGEQADMSAGPELILAEAEIALEEARYDEALRLLGTLPRGHDRQVDEALLRARTLVATGDLKEAINLLQEALEASGHESPGRRAELMYELGSVLYRARAIDEALGHFRNGLEILAQESGDVTLMGKMTVYVGHILFVRGEIDSAIDQYRRAKQLFEPLGDLGALGSLYAGMGRAFRQKGDLQAALQYSRRSVQAFRAKQEMALAARELNTLATRYREVGQLEEAQDAARQAAERAHTVGDIDTESAALAGLAEMALERGETEIAQQHARTSIDVVGAETTTGSLDAQIVLARIAESRGDTETADRYFTQALAWLREKHAWYMFRDVALAYSGIMKARGQLQEALDLAVQAAEAQSS
jgi:tetratricopeptide (TPR) repeat protein